VEQTEGAILAFAVKCAQRSWEDSQQPFLLAKLSPALVQEGVRYKDVLGEKRLKDFLLSAPDKIKVVVHPSQKARIGLVPVDKEFEYTEELNSYVSKSNNNFSFKAKKSGISSGNIILDFIQLLSELDDSDVAQVQIPTHILTKLMRSR
jgi:hypothetical protein